MVDAPLEKDLGIVKKAALVVENQTVLWVGPGAKLPSKFKKMKSVDCKNKNIFSRLGGLSYPFDFFLVTVKMNLKNE